MFTVGILVAVTQLLPAIVAGKVAENEAFYRNIDVSYTSEYRLAAGRATGELRTLDGQLLGRTTLAKDWTTRVVLQKEMYRVGVATKTNDGKEMTTRSSAHAYDGKTTLIREGDVTHRLDGPRPMPREVYFPHLWATAPSFESFPLSAILAGGKRWEDVRERVSSFKGRPLTSRVENLSGTFGGEPCVVVRCQLSRPPRAGVSSSWVYWLAVNKNFLPIKTESYEHSYSKTLPIEMVECGDFRQLRPGIWVPYKVIRTVYDEIELRGGKRVVSNVTKTSVTAAKLDPTCEEAFFRDVGPEK